MPKPDSQPRVVGQVERIGTDAGGDPYVKVVIPRELAPADLITWQFANVLLIVEEMAKDAG